MVSSTSIRNVIPILERQFLIKATCTLLILSFVLKVNALSSTNRKFAQHFKTKVSSSEAKAERRRKERELGPRELCSNCHRPPILCVCEALPKEKIKTSTHVLVLQHPNEFKRKSLSTVPLMPLVLENCTVKVGYNFDPNTLELVKQYLEEGKKPLLLFPGPDAISLDHQDEELKKTALCSIEGSSVGKGELLLLIDGTWAEARRILMQSPSLIDVCQQVQFSLEYESIYDAVRKEPEKHCISTLEACAESLILLEKDQNIALRAKESLEKAMTQMIEVKKRIHKNRNPEPRFTRPGMKEADRAAKAKRLEEKIFGRDQ